MTATDDVTTEVHWPDQVISKSEDLRKAQIIFRGRTYHVLRTKGASFYINKDGELFYV